MAHIHDSFKHGTPAYLTVNKVCGLVDGVGELGGVSRVGISTAKAALYGSKVDMMKAISYIG